MAERAVQELEHEFKREVPEGGLVTPVQLASAVSMFNSQIRSRGLSAREMWFQRDQYTNAQLPLQGRNLIVSQHNARVDNNDNGIFLTQSIATVNIYLQPNS